MTPASTPAIATPLAEIDSLIAAFYAAFDNRDARAPASDELRRMFIADARVTRVSSVGVETWSVEEFIAPRVDILTNGTLLGFHEWECESRTNVFGLVASRHSRYRKAGTLSGVPYTGEGHKFIQLCRIAGCWRIVSVLWYDV